MATTDSDAVRELLRDSFTRLIEHVDDVTDGLTDEVVVVPAHARGQHHRVAVWHSARVQDAQLCDIAGIEQVWFRDGWVDRFDLDLPRDSHGYGHSAEEVAKVRAPAELLAGYYHAVHHVDARVRRVGDARRVGAHRRPPLDARRSPQARGSSASSTTARSTSVRRPIFAASRRLDDGDDAPSGGGRWSGWRGWSRSGSRSGKASTPLDDWFKRAGAANPYLGRLLFFTDGRVLFVVLGDRVGGGAVSAPAGGSPSVIVATPLVAIVAARAFKRLFGRLERRAHWRTRAGTPPWPSSSSGMAVLAGRGDGVVGGGGGGVRRCSAMLGQAFTYHYFTDTVGALFLGTALVCLAARAAELDRCQPRCDLRHSSG